MNVLVFAIICATLFQYGSTKSCEVCEGQECEQRIFSTIRCTPDNSILPIEIRDLTNNGNKPQEYKCLDLMYQAAETDLLYTLKQCIFIEPQLDLCEELRKTVLIGSCEISDAASDQDVQYEGSNKSSQTLNNTTTIPTSSDSSTETTAEVTTDNSNEPGTSTAETESTLTPSAASTTKTTTLTPAPPTKTTLTPVPTTKATLPTKSTATQTTESSTSPTTFTPEITTAGASLSRQASLAFITLVIGYIVF